MATVVHIVMFRFRPEIPSSQKSLFKQHLKTLKSLPCVKDNRLIVGGPSITDPIARSQGYHYCLVSYHQDRKALEEYQASKEHHEVTSKYMWPYIDEVHRFDFEVDAEDEYMVGVPGFCAPGSGLGSGVLTPAESESGSGRGEELES